MHTSLHHMKNTDDKNDKRCMAADYSDEFVGLMEVLVLKNRELLKMANDNRAPS